ncbi:MAG: putative histidine kinase, classic [Ramlibacter sp.]|jgi:signal transduction histidine kinase|nr:putative histidine kinase, classic [Ramlibacter sp.]
MQPEPVPPPTPSDEAQWVEGALVRSLMRTQRNSQWVSLLLMAVLLGVLWGDAPTAVTSAWAALGLFAVAARAWVLRRYDRDVVQRGTGELLAFFRRWRLVWPLSALFWGLTTILYFDRSSLADQFICWLIMAGLAMYSIHSLSSERRTMRAYLDTLGATALAVVSWRMVVELRLQGPAYHWWLVALLLLFWQVLRLAGERLHETHRRNFELQFRNAQLIDSLTRQTQAALDAVEIKNRFLASAAHDIRQPVHALGLYADWLGSEPELVHELAPKIVNATKAVNQLFDSLFDLARLDSGKIRLNIEPVDVGKLLRDLELQYRPLCEAKGLHFRLHVRPGTATSDPILLQRVLGNLISNAVKYTQRGGLLVASRATREGLRIEIWDTGVGIAPIHQREIFREFYKVPTHAGTDDGFGLGLYIVARLTHILGHALSLSSRPGRGTVFRLVLQPTDAAQAAERARSSLASLLPTRGGAVSP